MPVDVGLDRTAPRFSGGLVAASTAEAAAAAGEVLARGGNAVDAAAVAQFVLNVVEPQSSGIGGGGFMLVYHAPAGLTAGSVDDSGRSDSEADLVVVDARERAPAAATPDMFLDADGAPLPFAVASTGGAAVGVPGTLRGIEMALGRWGSISLAEALAPAIAAAEAGITVSPRLAESIAEGLAPGGRLANEAGDPAYGAARAVFAPNGRPAAAGETLRQPDLARTLRLIAVDGTDAFYDCRHPAGIARAIVAAQTASRRSTGSGTGTGAGVAKVGRGRMTCADLAAYRAIRRAPVEAEYRGLIVASTPPPSSGGLTLIQMLTMLERFPIGDANAGFGFGSAPTLDVMQQAMRLAYADRDMWIGDPDLVAGLPFQGLINRDYLQRRTATCPDGNVREHTYCIAPGVPLPDARPGDPRVYEPASTVSPPGPIAPATSPKEGLNTTHLTVIDRWGTIVSYTSSIEASFGSGLMVPGFGFLLNNEMTDFNLRPQRTARPAEAGYDPGANDIAPFKRPRSSMAPTMLFAHTPGGIRPVAAFGTPGGPTIINTLLAVTLNLIDYRLTLADAIARPRLSLSHPADGSVTQIEKGFALDVLDRLRAEGYRFESARLGAVQAIVIDPVSGEAQGIADARRNGTVVGLP
ncbi:MAG: gamma-glutamyltransferase [Rhodospirillales bacterium]|nr:gamma-glutamyltransferase [Rhodospirillales bacterium]